ncbi:MAG: TonB-dependent receptor [Pseudoxanthomonas sp.]
MKLKRNKLRDAIAVSLAVGAATLATAGTALAQDASTGEQAANLDTITVTGSRIKSQTVTASSPVTEISAEEFTQSGATKVEDLVNQYPQLDLNFDNFMNNPSAGYASVSLRNLGAARTLTLVNGRRLPKGSSETTDISIIPAALVKRVDILTGGASAVYGSDAVAGVVNFILDDEFDGVYVNAGYSAYQHDNDTGYLRTLLDARGFDYPDGNSGFDGISRNIDLAIGGNFGESGHAMAWATWRKNEPLLQGQRDYSSCTVNDGGTACGGSATSDPANFYIYSDSYAGYAYPADGSTWTEGYSLYNYAPINYYQRPDTRFTAGTSVKYEINEHFQPYLETMFVNRKSSTQIAPSGAFFTDVTVNCDMTDIIGTLCTDLGITDTDDFTVYVAKRNVEGGPRISQTESTTYRIVGGVGGAINDYWSYDASFLYGRAKYSTTSINDFITTYVQDALLGCPDGSFDGCIFYDVWHDAVTTEAAQALAGIGMTDITTELKVFNAYATGDLGVGLPSADGQNINLVAGVEYRTESYERVSDTNTIIGNFTGVGGAYPNAAGSYSVKEVFLESAIPLIADAGPLDYLGAEFGYRFSDYSTSGGVQTYKVGLTADFADKFHLRTSWNRAIRAPSITDLYTVSSLGLWGGSDPCAGTSPTYTLEQCMNTGVTEDQYGSIGANPAGQYNSYTGGNLDLQPETATTWTVGLAVTPIDNLNLSVDLWNIKIKDIIRSIEESTIISTCALTGDADMCSLIHRGTGGSLWLGDTSYVVATTGNFGWINYSGIDLNASYSWGLGAGRMSASFAGTYALKKDESPLAGVSYDCVGLVNEDCGSANYKWRHVASLRYAIDRYSVGLRWRYIGELDSYNTDGSAVSDYFLSNNGNKLDAYNYFDLSGSIDFGEGITWTLGVNNIADKEPPMVGTTLSGTFGNGNSLNGYDQAGRYIFTSVSLKF